MYRGIGASSGVGIGKACIIRPVNLDFDKTSRQDAGAEKIRFKEAAELFTEKTMALAEDIKQRVSEHDAEILEGHIMMIQDPSLETEVNNMIDDGMSAEAAFDSVCEMFINIFSAADDELTKQRVTDIKDMRERMLKLLLNIEDYNIAEVPAGTIIVAVDLTPSMTAGINPENVVGIITESGGMTSHSAILARALEIPAVLSVDNICDMTSNGDFVIVDGSDGLVIPDPDEKTLKSYREKRTVYLQEKEELKKYRGRPTMTADGLNVALVGNIGNAKEAAKVVENGGEGVGLFRTEFLFLDKEELPDEEEQFAVYKEAILALPGKPLIIRTLDIGGDKEVPCLKLPKEENPFLGYRAIRLCLQREEIYRSQLRAILRASAYGDISIMVPFVTCVDELTEVRKLVEEIKTELHTNEIPFNRNIKVGMMMETPAATLMADELAKEADFFSIGTNDLTQYTMAVDRGNAKVAYLYSTYNPAVLRAIRHIISCARQEGIMAGMCGEAAADPLLIPLFISFGLEEFSVSASSILKTRKIISLWDKAKADVITGEVMKMTTETQVREYLIDNAIKG